MKFPKAILFDFDGVIVDSFDAHYEAWKSAFFKLFNKLSKNQIKLMESV